MLNNRIIKEKPSDEEMKTRLKALQEKLAAQTLAVREHKLPVIVLVEGYFRQRQSGRTDHQQYRSTFLPGCIAGKGQRRRQTETISLAICKRDTGSRQFCLYGFRLDGSAYA